MKRGGRNSKKIYLLLLLICVVPLGIIINYVLTLIGGCDEASIIKMKKDLFDWNAMIMDISKKQVQNPLEIKKLIDETVDKVREMENICRYPVLKRGMEIEGWKVSNNFSFFTQHFNIYIGSMMHTTMMNQLYKTFKLLDQYAREKDICYSVFGGTLISLYANSMIPWDDDIDIWVYEHDWKKLLELWENAWEPDLTRGECQTHRNWRVYGGWRCKLTNLMGHTIELLSSPSANFTLKMRVNDNKHIRSFFIDVYHQGHVMVKGFTKYFEDEVSVPKEEFQCPFVEKNFLPPYENQKIFSPDMDVIEKMLKEYYGNDNIDRRKMHPEFRKEYFSLLQQENWNEDEM